MSGRKFSSSVDKYRFGFQNQEEDQELWGGAVSFKYRLEDPRLGRFFSIDPLADDFPWNSPYAFSENRVMDGIELEGLEVILLKEKGDDAMIYQAALKDKDKSVLSIYAHGNPDGFNTKTDYGWIENAAQFDEVLRKLSPEYNAARRDNKEIVIVLHSCRTARTRIELDPKTGKPTGKPTPPIAALISTIPGVTIIAPDEPVAYGLQDPNDPKSAVEVGPRKAKYTDSNGDYTKFDSNGVPDRTKTGTEGNWKTYEKGTVVDQNKNLGEAKEKAKAKVKEKTTSKPSF